MSCDNDCICQCEAARCVWANDVEGLRAALAATDWRSLRLDREQSLLHLAAWLGKIEIVRLLLDHQADVDLLDAYNDSPLMLAVGSGHAEVVRLLLQRGAKPFYRIKKEQSEEDREQVVRMRAEMRQRLQSEEERAKLVNVLAITEPLLARPDEEFFRPPQIIEFHVLDDCESVEVLKVLIDEFKVDPNRVDDCGYWPLKRFVENDDLETVRWLLAHGANVDCTSHGETALFRAVWNNNLDMLRLLLESGANPNQRDCDGDVPLHCARSADAARLLIAHGADPTLRNYFDSPCMARTLEEMEQDVSQKLQF